MKPTIYAVAILAAVFGLMWLEAVTRNSTAKPITHVQLTRKDYQTVEMGMTIPEVLNITGAPTHDIESKSKSGRINILYWQGDKQSAKLTFIDTVLTHKTNAGITPATGFEGE